MFFLNVWLADEETNNDLHVQSIAMMSESGVIHFAGFYQTKCFNELPEKIKQHYADGRLNQCFDETELLNRFAETWNKLDYDPNCRAYSLDLNLSSVNFLFAVLLHRRLIARRRVPIVLPVKTIPETVPNTPAWSFVQKLDTKLVDYTDPLQVVNSVRVRYILDKAFSEMPS